MAVNILDQFKNEVVGSLANAASGFLGESETTTKNVLETIAPTLLGSLIQKGSTEAGASSILNMLNQDNTNVLGDLSNLVSGGESSMNNIMNSGLSIVRSLLGDKLGGVIDWISNKNNVKSSSVSSLMSLAAPFLMGLISRRVKSDNLGVSGLMDLLKGQGSWVKSLMPAGLSGLLNFSNWGDTRTTTTASTTNNDNNSGGGMGRILPWLLLLAGLILLWFLLRSCDACKPADVKNDTIDTVAQNVGDAVDTLAAKTTDALDAIKGKLNDAGDWIADLGNDISIKLPDGVDLKVGERSVEKKLVDFINTKTTDTALLKNTWFSFDRLYFETGKSTLTAESQLQLKNIYAILKAYPSVNLKLGGYTDSDGDDVMNQKLSAARANTAKMELQKLGVGAARLTAEGYGESHPICPANDTPECKAQNRRIDVRVTKM